MAVNPLLKGETPVEYFTCSVERMEREDVIRLLRFQLKNDHLNALGRRRAIAFLANMSPGG